MVFSLIGKYTGRNAFAQFNSDVGKSVNNYKGLVGQVTNLNRGINVFGATIRQVGQGLQNMGTTLTALVSLPLGLAISSATTGLLEFDKGLIEIRKNADITFDQLDRLKEGLVDLSTTTPTALVELVQIAADAARVGLPTDQIVGFTQVIDQLAQATGTSVEDSTKNVAKLANIFYKPEESAKTYLEFIASLGSSLNELDQAIVGNANEIISAALRIAPAAAAAGISIQDLLGISASMVEVSSSPERIGTQTARAISEMASRAADIAESAGLVVDEYRSMLDDDPVAAFLAVAESISQIESASLRAAAAEQLFGQIGGKAVNIIGEITGSGGKMYDMLALSNSAFEEGTSLQMEFERSLDSVSSQLGLLKNNLNVIAVSMGDVILPIVTKIVSYAVPAVRRFAEWFDNLEDKVKLAAVGILLFGAVIGPVLFAVGSLLFSLGIITTGLTTAMAGLFGLLVLPLRLAFGFLALLNPMNLFIVALGAVASAIYLFGANVNDIITGVTDLGTSMFSWGQSIVYSFINGMRSAFSNVAGAISNMLGYVAVFFESNSPPKRGPLSSMDVWGKNVAQSFVDGFSRASMQPVLTFGGLIRDGLEAALRSVTGIASEIYRSLDNLATSAVTALGNKLGLEDEAIDSNVLTGMESVANAVNQIVSSGQAAASTLSSMNAALGPFTQDFIALINMQMSYNSAVENLARIRKEQDDLDPNLQKEIERISAMTGLSVAERAAMIRAAKMRRDMREKELAEEEKVASEQVEITRDRIDEQQALISSLVDALRTSTPDKETVSDDETIPIPGINLANVQTNLQAAKDALDKLFDGAIEDGGRFIKMMGESEQKIDAFLLGWRGGAMGGFGSLAVGEENMDAFNLGVNMRTQYERIKGVFEDIEARYNEFWENIERARRGESSSLVSTEQLEGLKRLAVILSGVGAAFSIAMFGPAVVSGISAAVTAITTALAGLLGPALLVAAAIGILFALLYDMEPVTSGAANGFALIWEWAIKVKEAFINGLLFAFTIFGGDIDRLKRNLLIVWDGLKKLGGAAWEFGKLFLERVINVFGAGFSAQFSVFGATIGLMVAAFDWLLAAIVAIPGAIEWIGNALAPVTSFLGTIWNALVGYLVHQWQQFVAFFMGTLAVLGVDMAVFQRVWDSIVGLWDRLVAIAIAVAPYLSIVWVILQALFYAFVGVLGAVWSFISPMVEGILGALGNIINFVVSWAVLIVAAIVGTLASVVYYAFAIIASIIGGIASAISWLIDVFPAIAGAMGRYWSWVASTIGGWAEDILRFVYNILVAIGNIPVAIADGLLAAFNWIFTQVGVLVTNMYSWGGNIAQAFLDGWASINPLPAIGGWLNSFVSFLRGFSPPVDGPLSEIDVWGANVAQSYLDGFTGVDTSVAGGLAGNIASNFGPSSAAFSSMESWGLGASTNFLGGFASANTEPANSFMASIDSWMNPSKGAFSNVGTYGSGVGQDFLSGLNTMDITPVDDLAARITKALTDGISDGIDQTGSFFDSLKTSTVKWIVSNTSALKQYGEDIATRIAAGLWTYFFENEGMFDIISATLSSWRKSFFAGANDITSVGRSIGEEIGESISKGIQSKSSVIGLAISSMIGGSVSSDSNSMKLAYESVAKAVSGGLTSAIALEMAMASSVERILKSLADMMFAVGVAAHGRVGSGKALIDNAYSVGQLIRGQIKSAIGEVTITSNGTEASELWQQLLDEYSSSSLSSPVIPIDIPSDLKPTTTVIELNINGPLNVDSKQRVEELAERIAYKLGQNTSVRYRMGGVGV
jgi:TP901 family phage tail tape measure protein